MLSRRNFFGRLATGLHGAALAALLDGDLFAADRRPPDLKPRPPHHPAKARAVMVEGTSRPFSICQRIAKERSCRSVTDTHSGSATVSDASAISPNRVRSKATLRC